MFVGINGKPPGSGGFRSHQGVTPEAIAELHRLGLKIIMLTGDNERTATLLRRNSDRSAEAGVEPQRKNARVQQLRRRATSWRWLAMASTTRPRCRRSRRHAMGTGTDVAMESAGITLVKGDLRGIVKTIILSRAMMRNIRQNLFSPYLQRARNTDCRRRALSFFGLLLSPSSRARR